MGLALFCVFMVLIGLFCFVSFRFGTVQFGKSWIGLGWVGLGWVGSGRFVLSCFVSIFKCLRERQTKFHLEGGDLSADLRPSVLDVVVAAAVDLAGDLGEALALLAPEL